MGIEFVARLGKKLPNLSHTQPPIKRPLVFLPLYQAPKLSIVPNICTSRITNLGADLPRHTASGSLANPHRPVGSPAAPGAGTISATRSGADR